MAVIRGWVKYRNASGGTLWHRWSLTAEASLCGHAKVPERVERMVDATSIESFQGHVCSKCYAAFARKKAEDLPTNRPHLQALDCACDNCRSTRRTNAEAHMEAVNHDIARIACRCVREAVQNGAWGDKEIPALLRVAEARLAQRLLTWEMTGAPDARQDVVDGAALLLDCWTTVARIFEDLGNRHRCTA